MLPAQKARILAEALPYIRAFHGATLVIRLGGRAMVDPALKAGFARDVALLRLVGMKPIVVHGGGWRIDELLGQMRHRAAARRAMRVTDEAHAERWSRWCWTSTTRSSPASSTGTAGARSASTARTAGSSTRAGCHRTPRRRAAGRSRATSATSNASTSSWSNCCCRAISCRSIMPIGVGERRHRRIT